MRIRQRKKTNFLKTFVILFGIITTFFLGLGYSLLSEEIEITGAANIPHKAVMEIEYEQSSWTQGAWIVYQFEYTITNVGNKASSSWSFSQSVPADIRNLDCWNMVCTENGTTLQITNASWNGVIQPGESVTPGMQFRTDDPNYEPEPEPDPDPDPEPDPELTENIVIQATVSSSWQSGNRIFANYSVDVTNENEVEVSNWQFDMTKPQQGQGGNMESMWNANYVDEGSYFEITHAGWNSSIASNATINFGFQISMHRNDSWNRNFRI